MIGGEAAGEEPGELFNLPRKLVGAVPRQRAIQYPRGAQVGGRPSDTEIDTIRVKRRQRAELLRDD